MRIIRKARIWEMISAHPTLDKWVISRIYKELIHLNKKKKTSLKSGPDLDSPLKKRST